MRPFPHARTWRKSRRGAAPALAGDVVPDLPVIEHVRLFFRASAVPMAEGAPVTDYASAAADMAHSYGAFGIGLTNSRSVLPVTELVPSMTIGAALLSRFAIGIRM